MRDHSGQVRILRPLPSSRTDRVSGAKSATVARGGFGGTRTGVVEKTAVARNHAGPAHEHSRELREHGIDFVLLEVRHGRHRSAPAAGWRG